MARGNGVERTFIFICKTGNTSVTSQRAEGIRSSRNNFMSIALMAHVEYNAVSRAIEGGMKGKRKLYRSEIRREVSSVFRDRFKNFAPYFLSKGPELFRR